MSIFCYNYYNMLEKKAYKRNSSEPEIKAIIFDFIGVLLAPRENYELSQTAREIDRIIGGVTDDTKFAQDMMSHYGLSAKEFRSVLEQIVNSYEAFLPLWEMLPKLSGEYKLAVINNGTALTIPAFKKQYKLDDNFDLFVSSALESIKKPALAIYQLAAARLGVEPAECLFMDDSLVNVRGAEQAGMLAIHWNSHKNGLLKFKKLINF